MPEAEFASHWFSEEQSSPHTGLDFGYTCCVRLVVSVCLSVGSPQSHLASMRNATHVLHISSNFAVFLGDVGQPS